MFSRTPFVLLAALAVMLGFPGVGAGQADAALPPWMRFTGGLVVGQPVGTFAKGVGGAVGWEFSGRIPLDGSDRVALRVFLGDMLYGWKREKVCGSSWNPCDWPEAWTTNSVFFGGIGPEVSFEVGHVRPYLNLWVGFGQFGTTTRIRDGWWDWGGEKNDVFLEGAFSGGLGAGFDAEIRGGGNPIHLNFGAQYHDNGMAEYLTSGNVVHDPEGNVTLSPKTGPANFITYRIGFTIAVDRPGKEGPNQR